jgi:GAF domain-containing protein/HAMP domain-containing protein
MAETITTPQIGKSSAQSAPLLGSLSLRTKLILANTLIITLSIIGTGYYVYLRTNQANSFLASQLDKDILQQAKDQLINTSSSEASNLNNFFLFMRRDISIIGTTASNLLSLESTLNNIASWDATQSLASLPDLVRLPDGAWDNNNYQPSSVFVPAKMGLTPNLVTELNSIKQLDLMAPAVLKQNPDTVAVYFGGRYGEIIYYPNIDLAATVPPDFDVTSQPWYDKASPEKNPNRNSIWSTPYVGAGLRGLVVTISQPVYDSGGNFRGVTAVDIQLTRISELVSNIRVGQTGYAFLIDQDKRLIAMPEIGYSDLGITTKDFHLGEELDLSKIPGVPNSLLDAITSASGGKSGTATATYGGVERYISYDPVPEVGYGILIMVPSNELLAAATAVRKQIAIQTTNTYSRSILLVIVILVAALIVTLLIGNSLTNPLQALTRTAEEIIKGNLSAQAKVRSQDEVGTLAKTINSMTSSLKDMIQSLGQQVEQRTADLVRKTLLLQAAARIAHDATEIQDITILSKRTVDLISDRFGFYHTGIFLLDETRERAVLVAASSEGGQRMLARGHQLTVGVQGIVGAAAYQNRARVVMDIDQDKDFYPNPDLPATRSEAAFPLAARGKVLGVLDIQSTQVSAFQKEDVEVLQTMADQIGVAFQNARLISEGQETLKRLETATAGDVHRIWRERVRDIKHSFRYSSLGLSAATQLGGKPIADETSPDRMNIPITLRGQNLGNIVFRRASDNVWTETDRALATEIAGQVGLALENARLLDEAQRRAAQEQSLSELTAKLSRSLDPEILLQTAIRELHQLPNVSEVSVYLAPSEKSTRDTVS